jgi:DNA topoisomerase-1
MARRDHLELWLVESPAKGRTIQKLLRQHGVGVTVIATKGHLQDLATRDDGIQTVTRGQLPVYVTLPHQHSTVREIRAATRRLRDQGGGGGRVLLATDHDREGESIAEQLARVTRCCTTTSESRVVFQEVSLPALLAARAGARAIDVAMVRAQQTRRLLDRVVGYRLTKLLRQRYQLPTAGRLTTGRVQVATLQLLAERESARRTHVPRRTVQVTVGLGPWSLYTVLPLLEGAPGQDVIRRLGPVVSAAAAEGRGRDVSRDTKTITRPPPAPFTTASLQQVGSATLGVSTSQVMALAQALYEQGLITYHRTDSRHLSEEFVQTAQRWARDRYRSALSAPHALRRRRRRQVSGSAHEAIRVTDIRRTQLKAGGTSAAAQLYRLVWQRSLEAVLPPALIQRTLLRWQITAVSDALVFQGQVDRVQTLGYLAARPDFLVGPEQLPSTPAHTDLKFSRDVTFQPRSSLAPTLLSEGSLVQVMSRRGVGRPSTYASTIRKLLDHNMVIKTPLAEVTVPCQVTSIYQGRTGRWTTTPVPTTCRGSLPQASVLRVTEIGEAVLTLTRQYFAYICDADFTSRLETALDAIAASQVQWQPVLQAFMHTFLSDADKCEEQVVGLTRQTITLPSRVLPDKMTVLRLSRFGPVIHRPRLDGRPDLYVSLLPAMRQAGVDTYTQVSDHLVTLLVGLREAKEAGRCVEYKGRTLQYGRFGLYLQDPVSGKSSTLRSDDPLWAQPMDLLLVKCAHKSKQCGECERKSTTCDVSRACRSM